MAVNYVYVPVGGNFKKMKDPYPIEYYQTETNDYSVKSHLISDENELKADENNNSKHISSLFPETSMKLICGEDDREIIRANEYPYYMICRLLINDHAGNQYVATGFFISPTCVITSGHCVFFKNKWAKSIIVIPGDNGISDRKPYGSQVSTKFRSVKGWTKLKNRNFDYGAVLLPDKELYNRVKRHFNVKIISNEKILYNSGYTDESEKRFEQWGSSGNLKELTSHRVFYDIDTVKGNSGSPILVKSSNDFFVTGIHSYGKCPNYCVRINDNILKTWEGWK